jgi:hypothetical protein
MNVHEEFVIAQSPETLWEFFEQVDRVAQCVPGVEEVTVVDADNSRLRVTQALGPMTATFDLKMRITARDPGRSMEFTAVGRSVRGAAGNVRATHVVRLESEDGEETRVLLEGDVGLGGMLGSVGEKVVAKQAAVVAQSFAQELKRQLSGEPAEGVEAAEGLEAPEGGARGQEPAPPAGPPAAPAPARPGVPPTAIAGAIAVAVLILVVRRLRS